jgi:TPP-dependent pyruvate/acetoin dehydrogenase alpha subunit
MPSALPASRSPPRRTDGGWTRVAKRLYRQMFLIRRFEEEAARAYAQGKIGGFLHLYIGQEAVAVGASRRAPPGATT